MVAPRRPLEVHPLLWGMAAYARCTTRWDGSAREDADEGSGGAADWSGEQELTVLFEHACPCVAIVSADDRRFAAGQDLYGGEMRLRKLSTRLRLPRRLLHEPPRITRSAFSALGTTGFTTPSGRQR